MNEFSQWHSIRPWRPTLSLSVREITSVSATFVLSSPLVSSDSATVEQSLASLGLSNDEDDQDGDTSNRGPQIVSDVLSKGLSVKVNGTPWQRVLMRIDDEADEAVIILYGLMPGRQYDIELGIVPNEKTLRSQVTTIGHSPSDPDAAQDMSATDHTAEQANQAATILPPTDSAPQRSRPPSPSPSFSLEDRRLQLNHALSLLTAEHATLTSTLKSARRDSQKADAALRAEIEALRRASERAAPAELRARQKARALQEAARQASAAAEQVQARVQELEQALPDLVTKRDEVEREWERVRKEADAVRLRREEAESRERKRAEGKQSEMTSLAGRMERLSARKERLDGDGGVLGELEEKLRQLEEERQRIEDDPYGYSFEDGVEEEDDVIDSPIHDEPGFHNHHVSPYHPPYNVHQAPHLHPRKRHSHPPNQGPGVPSILARPDPIQRPGYGGRTSLPPVPGVIHLHHTHTYSVPTVHPVNGSTSGSSSSPSPGPVGASNLSSRAPAFEPRGVRSDPNPTPGNPFDPRVNLSSSIHGKPDPYKRATGPGRP